MRERSLRDDELLEVSRLARIDRDDPTAHLRLGLALQRAGLIEAAREAFERALALAPGREAPRVALREVLAAMAEREVPAPDGTVDGTYAVRRLLSAVRGEAPLRTYLAADLVKLRRVVLRVRSFPASGSRPDFERVAMRLLPARRLVHPNVSPVLDVRRLVGKFPHHVLVSEHRREPSLDRLIALGPHEGVRVARLLRQMLLAVEAAHRRGIVHRLLSPRKVHVAPDDKILVRDFGVADFLDDGGENRALGRGNYATAVLAYAPPELLVAGPRDRRADLYSTGAIAYALLAGRPPFAESSARERLRAILHEAPPPLPAKVAGALPAGLEGLVMRLMAKEADERPGSAREAIDALDAAVPGA